MLVPAIDVAHLTKTFKPTGRAEHRALSDASFQIMPGEMVALIGASGSGKSTLMRIIGGLACGDRGSRSRIAVHGSTVQDAGRLVRHIRHHRREIGVIFQQFNLVDRLPVLTNVLAGMLARVPLWRSLPRYFTAAEKRVALEALDRVGIAHLAYQRASTLSGGQQQRAAIARTLVQRARVILADEPIASLDPESSRRVMDLLQQINREDGTTVVVSLHQVDYALSYCQRVIGLRQGETLFDGTSRDVTPALLRDLYGGEAALELAPLMLPDRPNTRHPSGHSEAPHLAPAQHHPSYIQQGALQ